MPRDHQNQTSTHQSWILHEKYSGKTYPLTPCPENMLNVEAASTFNMKKRSALAPRLSRTTIFQLLQYSNLPHSLKREIQTNFERYPARSILPRQGRVGHLVAIIKKIFSGDPQVSIRSDNALEEKTRIQIELIIYIFKSEGASPIVRDLSGLPSEVTKLRRK